MRQTHPLPDTHPEFSVLEWSGFTEYRVENWYLARDGSGEVVHGTCVWSFFDLSVLFLLIVVLWRLFKGREGELEGCPVHTIPVLCYISCQTLALIFALVFIFLLWIRFTQVVHESLLVFPALGIQLETHRGHPYLPILATSHRFIPFSSLEDIILHEGLRRWNVRYYLAALKRTRRRVYGAEGDTSINGTVTTGEIEVCVAFENILPHFPVLHVVYLGVHRMLDASLTQVKADEHI